MHGLFFFRGEDCIRVFHVTGVQTCALPLFPGHSELALDVAVGDILEGKLIYDGSVHADGHVEGELRVTGNIDVATGASVKECGRASWREIMEPPVPRGLAKDITTQRPARRT